MLTNKAIAAAVVTAFVGQTAAFNSHRHLHRQVEKQLDKRALEVDWVTVWETVYVTAGQEPEPTAESKPENIPDAPAPEPTTTSTTSIVVAPTQPPAAEAPQPPAPAPQPTTMATSIKPAAPPAEEPSPEPVPQEPKPEQPEPEQKEEQADNVVLNPAQPEEEAEESQKPKDNQGSNKPSASGSPFSSKRGVAYNDPDLASHFGSSCQSCNWAWNWGSSSSGMEGMNFVPTLWGIETMHTDHWDADCEDAINSGSKAILSFNEPDHADQAAIPAALAAQSHAKFMNKYSGDVLVGSPSVTNSGNPGEGLEYLQDFMDACKALDGGCAIDFCNVHWYSEAAYSDTLFTHLEEAHKICDNKPIWLTEFAPLDTDPAVKDQFMKDIIPQLDEIPYLHAYSYFMVALDNLMTSSSSMSSFGELYASV